MNIDINNTHVPFLMDKIRSGALHPATQAAEVASLYDSVFSSPDEALQAMRTAVWHVAVENRGRVVLVEDENDQVVATVEDQGGDLDASEYQDRYMAIVHEFAALGSNARKLDVLLMPEADYKPEHGAAAREYGEPIAEINVKHKLMGFF